MKISNVTLNEKVTTKTLKEFKAGKINKSTCIRTLFHEGMSVKQISVEMGIIYNMVYNITKKEVIRQDLQVESTVRIKIEDQIQAVYDEMFAKDGKVKKSDIIRHFIKEGRGESYVYTKLKGMDHLVFTK